MIYTVTLNPSIDYIVEVDNFQPGHLNRTNREAKFPGGKGINVSRVLNRIGIENIALGFVGGFTGSFVKNFLNKESVHTDFIEVAGDTRINIKLKTGDETEINGLGPDINKEDYQGLIKKLGKLETGNTLVLAGSVPAAIPDDFYETVTKTCSERGVKVVVDTSGPALLDVLKHRPFLIKPNHHELGEIFDTQINSAAEAAKYAGKLLEKGAQHVIVSMGGDGAVLCADGKTYMSNVPKGKAVNTVGAGDSLVAGFTGMYSKTGNLLKSFKYGIAAGSATAFSTDLCQKEDIEKVYSQIQTTEI
ncbi:1-phosphofructokinase [Peribacillus sp. SCS-155]|uniref:1-phosphofructokinase n=1 Tax=Peribacillus sedimenti TaxID=3115297 RepID=UPI0039061B2B